VAYDGAAFDGWQRQPGRRTVQGVLETHLSEILSEPVVLTGAGRTDAGCHARGQVATFTTAAALPVRALRPTLTRRLPADLAVRDAAEAPRGFDARHSAVARRYAYRLLYQDDVLLKRFAWRPRHPMDPEGLVKAVAPLLGEQDFASFQAAGGTPRGSRCRIVRASWRPWEGGLLLDVIADHFLYHMVRNLVGTALAFQDRPDPAEAMRACLAARDRSRAGPTAPAHALCLEEVFYP